jgi:hypothetical protein
VPLQGSSNFESKDFSFVLITICNRLLFKGESEKKKGEKGKLALATKYELFFHTKKKNKI